MTEKQGIKFKVGEVTYVWNEGLKLTKRHLDIMMKAFQTEKQPEKGQTKQCICGEQECIGGAEVEIAGTCHRPYNPCYIITTPQEETWEKEFDKEFSTLYQGDVYANGGADFRPVHERLKHYIRTLLDRVRTQERERIEKEVKELGIHEKLLEDEVLKIITPE